MSDEEIDLTFEEIKEGRVKPPPKSNGRKRDSRALPKPEKFVEMFKLTHRQARFVLHYEGNASKAAEAAGFKHPGQSGHTLMQKEKVREAIKFRELYEPKPGIASRQERQRWWSAVMRGMDEKGNRVTYKMPDRLKASELLAKSEGDFLELKDDGQGGPGGNKNQFVVVLPWENQQPQGIEAAKDVTPDEGQAEATADSE